MAVQIQSKEVKKLGQGMPVTNATPTAGPTPSVNPPPVVQEFSIRVPKNTKKKFHMMRFNSTLNVDFSKWKQVRMERENNAKEYRGMEEEMPKFGAGSEFGREAREEARRKKFGIVARKYKPDDQPWILKAGGSKSGKKFKGIREGGVSENAGYYVFMKAEDGIIEAYPLQEWYNFQPIQRYKALSAEEAEEEFGRRHKQQNYFSLMMRKRLRPDEEVDLDDPDEAKGKRKGGGGKKSKELKISDMEEWMDSDDESDSDDNDEKEDDKEEKAEKKKKGKKEAEAKRKKKRDSDDEAFEESDDGDEEGREVDYISDSSLSVSDHDEKAKDEMKGVAEEDALRKLLTSDEESEEDEEKKEGEENSDADDKKEGEENKKDAADVKKSSSDKDHVKKKKKKKREADNPSSPSNKNTSSSNDKKDKGNDSMSDLSDSSDSEGNKKKDKKEGKESNSGNSSRSASPALQPDGKRKATSDALAAVAAKKAKLDNFASASASSNIAGASEAGITEDAVRRYLMRKPMTTTELLQKFKSKKTGLSSEQLVNIMTNILKKINVAKQTIKGKMYLSIKTQGVPKPPEAN